MAQAIPNQHPAVVLRSHYRHLRALLAVAMIAVVGLSAAVVILATHDERGTSAGSATQLSAPSAGSIRYDGGPEEGTRGVVSAREPGVRYDGGPEEGTAALTQRPAPATSDANPVKSAPDVRYDGGPEEGTRGALSSGLSSNALPSTRYDGGPDEAGSGSGH